MSVMNDGLWESLKEMRRLLIRAMVSKLMSNGEQDDEQVYRSEELLSWWAMVSKMMSKFIAQKNCALVVIVLSINPSLLYLLGDPTDPTVVWQQLSAQFQKKTWANKLALRRRLHSLRLKEGQSVQEHVRVLTEIFNELSVIGDNIDDEDRVIYLLASLPESYKLLVTALEANTNVPNMETVIERLLHEEQKYDYAMHYAYRRVLHLYYDRTTTMLCKLFIDPYCIIKYGST